MFNDAEAENGRACNYFFLKAVILRSQVNYFVIST